MTREPSLSLPWGLPFCPEAAETAQAEMPGAPFTAKTADVAFVLYSAPGATDYNVRLCAGEPGAGKWASDAVTVKVNDGVRFSGLTVGQAYYMEVSSDTLSTADVRRFISVRPHRPLRSTVR